MKLTKFKKKYLRSNMSEFQPSLLNSRTLKFKAFHSSGAPPRILVHSCAPLSLASISFLILHTYLNFLLTIKLTLNITRTYNMTQIFFTMSLHTFSG